MSRIGVLVGRALCEFIYILVVILTLPALFYLFLLGMVIYPIRAGAEHFYYQSLSNDDKKLYEEHAKTILGQNSDKE